VIESDRAPIERFSLCAEQRGVLKAEDAKTSSLLWVLEAGMHEHPASPASQVLVYVLGLRQLR
jgi:hypothetical protein